MTTEKISRQQAFDIIVERSKDKRKGQDENSQCRYRTEDPSKPKACFIGALIPDDVYKPSMEGRLAFSLMEKNEELLDYIPFTSRECSSLQMIHDNRLPEYWEQYLRDFAAKEGLEYKG